MDDDLPAGGAGTLHLAASLEERRAGAILCTESLGITLPTVTDDMSDSTNLAYGAWPDRLYIVGTDGRVAFAGAPGPMGFDPDALERSLREILGGS